MLFLLKDKSSNCTSFQKKNKEILRSLKIVKLYNKYDFSFFKSDRSYLVKWRLTTPSVFLLRFDLCRVATSSFCSLDTTGLLATSSTTPFLSRLGCCGKNSNLDGCFVSPSYAPILTATLLPVRDFETCAPLVGETDASEVLASSATGLVAASLGTLLPVPIWCGLPFEAGFVTGKYVGGGFGTVLGASFNLNDSMLCISTESSLPRFFEGSGSGGGTGGGIEGPIVVVVAAVIVVEVSFSTRFSCS